MTAFHSLRFHDVLHNLESVGYRPRPSEFKPGEAAYTVSEPNPDKIIDTLRLTQNFKVVEMGHYTDLHFANGEIIAVDADFYGTRIMEVTPHGR